MSTKLTYNNEEIVSFDSGKKVLRCNGKTMASDVVVESEGGVIPSGTIEINTNGIYDVTQYACADVELPTYEGGVI